MAEADHKSYHHLRSDIRFPTDFKAVLHWGDNFSCVQVANIASSGMRFIGRALPEQDDKVRVAANGLEVAGRVVWRTPHSCAVVLEQAIDPLAVVRANCFARHLAADKRPLDRIAPIAKDNEPCKRLPAAVRRTDARSSPHAAALVRAAPYSRFGSLELLPI